MLGMSNLVIDPSLKGFQQGCLPMEAAAYDQRDAPPDSHSTDNPCSGQGHADSHAGRRLKWDRLCRRHGCIRLPTFPAQSTPTLISQKLSAYASQVRTSSVKPECMQLMATLAEIPREGMVL